MPANITHPVVAPCQPPDSNIKIWRYMDVTKLVALMETQSLHFARADTLQDPFEGSLALVNKIETDQLITQIYKDIESNASHEIRCTHEQARENFAQITRKMRQWVFISCWHSGEVESLAMWKQYGSSGGSVVIQSTYQKLLDALPSNNCIKEDESDIVAAKQINTNSSIYMGMVQYKNYLSPQERFRFGGNALSPFIHKRTEFEYEKEVRALIMEPVPDIPSILSVNVNINVEQLVESIRVRPGTPDWERQTIETLIKKYNLSKKVRRSEIDIKPMF